MGLGGKTAGDFFWELDEQAGFMIRVDRQLVGSSSTSSSSFSSLPSSSSSLSSGSGVYLKEYLGWVQDARPCPNWILTDDTILQGERSEEGKEEDLCMEMPRLWEAVRFDCLARSKALWTREAGATGQCDSASSKNTGSTLTLFSPLVFSVDVSVSPSVSVGF